MGVLQMLNKMFCSFFILISLTTEASAAQLNHINIVQQQPLVLKFSVNGQDNHRIFILHNPERLVIDFPNTTTHFNANSLANSSLIKTARIGKPNAQTLRLVLETKQAVRFSTSSVANGWQLRLMPHSAAMVSSAKQSATKNSQLVKEIPNLPRGNRDVVVVLDPGHGGKDPGAIGMNHTCEKQVVLTIARQLKAYIDRQPGMRAVLTRNGDYYIGLRERMAIARRHNADLFIAIHADAYENHNSHGASVFALSQRGATSEAARWLAAKENYSELGGVNLSKLHDQNGVIRSVLIDLSQTATISSSLRLGNMVLRDLNHMTDLHSHKVEQARFMVLKSPDIPSLLIETGFISNPREEMNLNNPR